MGRSSAAAVPHVNKSAVRTSTERMEPPVETGAIALFCNRRQRNDNPDTSEGKAAELQKSGRLLLPGASRTAGIPFCCPAGSNRAFVLITSDR